MRRPGMACDLLRCRFSKDGTTETLFVAGELDIGSAPVFEQAVRRALDGQGQEFRIDMSRLAFMDSTGAKALMHVHTHVEGLGRRLIVVSPTREVRMVLDILGLDQMIAIQG
jgi:anti-sigma B factor antagonist